MKTLRFVFDDGNEITFNADDVSYIMHNLNTGYSVRLCGEINVFTFSHNAVNDASWNAWLSWS